MSTTVPFGFDITEDDGVPLSDELLIDFVVIPSHALGKENEDEVLTSNFRVDRQWLTSEQSSWSLIPQLLSEAGVPPQHQQSVSLIHCISKKVGSLYSLNHKLLVFIWIVETHCVPFASSVPRKLEARDFYRKITRCVDTRSIALSSPVALENVKIERGLEGLRCAICLEDFLIGSEATRTPCSHVYHGYCIFRWLQKSNLCPLCRFELSC